MIEKEIIYIFIKEIYIYLFILNLSIIYQDLSRLSLFSNFLYYIYRQLSSIIIKIYIKILIYSLFLLKKI